MFTLRRSLRATLVVPLLSLLTCWARVAPAAPLAEEDAQGAAVLGRLHPEALRLVLAGERASEPAQALELFRQAATDAPESPVPDRKRCASLLALGRRADAILACNQAVFKAATALNLRAAVAALLSGPSKPDARELADAFFFAKRAVEIASKEPWGFAAECEIALRIRDGALAHECLARLQEVAPNHFETRALLARSGAGTALWRIPLAWTFLLLGCALTVWRVARAPIANRAGTPAD